jgi:hypothetical protein
MFRNWRELRRLYGSASEPGAADPSPAPTASAPPQHAESARGRAPGVLQRTRKGVQLQPAPRRPRAA